MKPVTAVYTENTRHRRSNALFHGPPGIDPSSSDDMLDQLIDLCNMKATKQVYDDERISWGTGNRRKLSSLVLALPPKPPQQLLPESPMVVSTTNQPSGFTDSCQTPKTSNRSAPLARPVSPKTAKCRDQTPVRSNVTKKVPMRSPQKPRSKPKDLGQATILIKDISSQAYPGVGPFFDLHHPEGCETLEEGQLLRRLAQLPAHWSYQLRFESRGDVMEG